MSKTATIQPRVDPQVKKEEVVAFSAIIFKT